MQAYNHVSILKPKLDPTPALGNTWKFTASVAILALATSMLIVCAVKGPSWYKLFHNYRHRQLQQEVEEGDEDFVSTEFSATGRHQTHQTFSFEPMNRQIDEEQEYFEDPYIRREEWHAQGETTMIRNQTTNTIQSIQWQPCCLINTAEYYHFTGHKIIVWELYCWSLKELLRNISQIQALNSTACIVARILPLVHCCQLRGVCNNPNSTFWPLEEQYSSTEHFL